MKLPPHSPEQMRQKLAKQPDLRRRIARGWMIVGSLLVVFIGAMAVGHYVYGVPVHNNNTGELATPSEVLSGLLVIGGGGALFVILGFALYRWDPN